MTKLRVLSDVHLDHSKFNLASSNWCLPPLLDDKETILVFAGDLSTFNTRGRCEEFLEDLSKRFKYVIAVMGNHDYWGAKSIDRAVNEYKELFDKFDNTYLLENEHVNLGGILFSGATLWTDMVNTDLEMMQQLFSDYVQSGLTPYQTVERFHETMDYLSSQMNGVTKKRVVITHHAPSIKSVAPQWLGHAMTPAFASDLDAFISQSGFNLWIHGHVHNHNDYTLGSTRVISNPVGYPGELDVNYNPNLVIEL